jgi:hypothetical protein
VELVHFAQDRFKRHGQTAVSLKSLSVGVLQMDWLRSEDLKEVKNVTAPLVSIAGVPLTGGLRDGMYGTDCLPLISLVSQSKQIRYYPL